MILAIWVLGALLSWIAVLTFTDYVRLDDDPGDVFLSLVLSALACATLWPFVVLTGVGRAFGGKR